MKKAIFPLILLMLAFQGWGQGQGWVYISGTVSDLPGGLPVPDHAVTILTDSTNGVLYYKVVYTDSAGYYHDEVPIMADSTGFLYVQTFDCNGVLYQGVFEYNPVNNTFTQDFQICNSSVSCQAQFTYYPEPQGSPDSFQFTDLSTGDISEWFWSFGDSTFSGEQNPFHAYPGPGTYDACLTITGNNCTDSYCQTIVISDTVYQQIYGQVFAGNFPLQSGTVQMFAFNPGGTYTPFSDAFHVDSNGIYYFTLVPEGIYLIQAVPYDSNGYLPTYFGDVINWQQATQVVLGTPDNPYNINLVPAGLMTPGPGSVSGQINNANLQRSAVDKINMMLMNESFVAIGFSRVSSSGYFEFPAMDYGTYYLRAELPGVACDNLAIEITPEKPHLDVVLSFSGNSILGTDDEAAAAGEFIVYPNPVSDRLNISMITTMDSEVVLTLYNITGQVVYQGKERVSQGHQTCSIPAGNLPAGIYTLRVTPDGGMNFVRKVIISR